jgi:hypothetical protein
MWLTHKHAKLLEVFCQVENLRVDIFLLSYGLNRGTAAPAVVFPKLKRMQTDDTMDWVDIPGYDHLVWPPGFDADVCFPVLETIESQNPMWAVFFPHAGGSLSVMARRRRRVPGAVMLRNLLAMETFTNLRSFRLGHFNHTDDGTSCDHAFRPLLQCSFLEEFDISISAQFAHWMKDDDVIEMGQHWRLLKLLSIQVADSDGSDARSLSFNALVQLIGQCLNLHSISLSMEIGGTLPMHTYRYDGRYRADHPHFGSSTIGEPGKLAMWLRNICPANGISWEVMTGSEKLLLLKGIVEQLQVIG